MRPATEGSAIQSESKRAAPSLGGEAALGLVRLLGEVGRGGDLEPLRIGDVQRAGRVRAAQPLLARDGVEVVRPAVDRYRADRLRAVDEKRHVERGAQLRQPAGRDPYASSRARGRPGACAGRPPPRSRRRPRPTQAAEPATRTVAPDACSGPRSPKCSSSVVTTSSPGWSPRPATAMLQPRVVEVVSATCSGGTEICAASRSRDGVTQVVQVVPEARPAALPCVEVALEPLLHRLDRRPRQRPERARVQIREALEHREGGAGLLDVHVTRTSSGAWSETQDGRASAGARPASATARRRARRARARDRCRARRRESFRS